jgi:hypothetical protein
MEMVIFGQEFTSHPTDGRNATSTIPARFSYTAEKFFNDDGASDERDAPRKWSFGDPEKLITP